MSEQMATVFGVTCISTNMPMGKRGGLETSQVAVALPHRDVVVFVPDVMFYSKGGQKFLQLPDPYDRNQAILVRVERSDGCRAATLDKTYPLASMIGKRLAFVSCSESAFWPPYYLFGRTAAKVHRVDDYNLTLAVYRLDQFVDPIYTKEFSTDRIWSGDKPKKEAIEPSSQDLILPALALPDFKPRTIALAIGGQLVKSAADSITRTVLPMVKRQLVDQLWSSVCV